MPDKSEIRLRLIVVPIGNKKVILLLEYLTLDESSEQSFSKKDRMQHGTYLLSLKELSYNVKEEESICQQMTELYILRVVNCFQKRGLYPYYVIEI